MPDARPSVQVLPHQILGREEPSDETFVMTTLDKEQYQCTLPQITNDIKSVGAAVCVLNVCACVCCVCVCV